MLTQIHQRYLKVVIFILSLLPIFYIIYQILTNQLGPEPIKDITHHTGKWTLYFIVITLTMTPLKKITKINIWINYRRMFGLFIFFYASVHLMTYIGLDYRFNLKSIGDDIIKKKYIFIGFLAWLLLIPLAVTSNKKMMKILKDKWKKLHRLIYLISLFGVIHYLWLVKRDLTEPLIFLIIILILLIFRLKFKYKSFN
jgi:sulfoxide reductase heme-binding subunit YedZ|tara:strand:+ start:329 stop:922 length:594 start_codon:yes stop_codon:yes gene_type:complete